jgi:uroporphyrinogen-III decarboxylase
MTPRHWETLRAVLAGERIDPLPVGFHIDSPWLPNWAGMSILDYFASETMWLEANLKAVRTFPDAIFLPGFWSEFGMCSEPSAFGSRPVFQENDLPFAEATLAGVGSIASMPRPDPRRHGLAPLILKRLVHLRPAIEAAGHQVRFAVARGPLNVAAFLMDPTDFLVGLKTEPEPVHDLLDKVTDYLIDWLKLQAAAINTIDGVLILDDIVGFLSPDDFTAFARPYLRRTFQALDVSVRLFHNDASGLVCASHLAEIGVNLFNFSSDHDLALMRRLAGDRVALLGNIPPRDVLARGTPEDVARAVRATLQGAGDATRLILSCGGGMPPGVTTENIRAFLEATRSASTG